METLNESWNRTLVITQALAAKSEKFRKILTSFVDKSREGGDIIRKLYWS